MSENGKELVELITRIQTGIAKNASYIKTIRDPKLLVSALKELQELIGNDKVKDSVATQVSHLIMLKRRAMEHDKIKEDNVMLNTVLYGPPGVGKTLVGTKLAKIWYALGYLDGKRNSKEKHINETLKDIIKEGNGGSTDDTALLVYIVFMAVIVLMTFGSMIWSIYAKLGGKWTLFIICFCVLLIAIITWYISGILKSDNQKPRFKVEENKTNESMVRDDQVVKIVSRADFVDKYVGWTAQKTNKLLQDNLGKVLFIDEGYNLINGPHDEFGMEALTALNLFLSQRPKEIIVIMAGYKDLIESGPFSVQPGLKRRFMWQFDCSGYSPAQLFEIFKLQLAKKGWGLSNEEETLKIFLENFDAFVNYGGDTEKAGFFSELEHSRDYVSQDPTENKLQLNMLEPEHVLKGIEKLRENNMEEDENGTTNPMANVMKLFQGEKKKPQMKKPEKLQKPEKKQRPEEVEVKLSERVSEIVEIPPAEKDISDISDIIETVRKLSREELTTITTA